METPPHSREDLARRSLHMTCRLVSKADATPEGLAFFAVVRAGRDLGFTGRLQIRHDSGVHSRTTQAGESGYTRGILSTCCTRSFCATPTVKRSSRDRQCAACVL